jgi:hypothetical protein
MLGCEWCSVHFAWSVSSFPINEIAMANGDLQHEAAAAWSWEVETRQIANKEKAC